MNISKSKAKIETEEYMANGAAIHFRYQSNPIEGFLFTRLQLYTIIADFNNHIFMMLGVKGTGANAHLNLILGSVNCANNELDVNNLIESTLPPHTQNVNIAGSPPEIKYFNQGRPVSKPELEAMQNKFQNSNNNAHLTSTNGTKVKGYHFVHSDIYYLDLRESVDANNQDDLFIFMPVIRDQWNMPFDREYLSMGVAEFDVNTSQTKGTIIEYCLPCPSACPKNYPIQ